MLEVIRLTGCYIILYILYIYIYVLCILAKHAVQYMCIYRALIQMGNRTLENAMSILDKLIIIIKWIVFETYTNHEGLILYYNIHIDCTPTSYVIK